MEDKMFGIDKGILRAFALMVAVVGILTTFYLSEYVSAIMLGSVFYTVNNGTSYTYTDVTNEAFTVYNTSSLVTELAHDNIVVGTLYVFNATDYAVIGLGNFTVVYAEGNISAITDAYNNTNVAANYTYETTNVANIPVTDDTNTLLSSTEDDFVTTLGYVNAGVKFAAALITVVSVILVFASFLPKKKQEGDLGY